MTDLLRSEWFKLRTVRLNYVLPIVGFAFVFVIVALVGIFSGVDGSNGPVSSEVAELVGFSAILPGLLISVVGVLAISSEFGHGTIRPTLVATPNRTMVFVAKALVLAVVGFVSGLVVALVGYIIGFVLLSARGADELNFLDSDGTIGVLFLGLPLLFTLLVLFGYGLGLLIRMSAAAVSIAILWPILIESILSFALFAAQVDEPQKFLPYQSALALVSTTPDDFANGSLGGGLYLAAVVTVLIVVAIFVNNRRDV